MKQTVDELVRRLVEAHGDDLLSVIMYGAVVRSDATPKASDVQLLVVTRSLPAAQLARSAPVMRWWMNGGFPRAGYFTRSELRNALDVFPIDFMQIQSGYRVLYGEDLLKGVEISHAHVRLLTEYELRGKLVRLRALYLTSSGDSRRTLQLMTDSVVSFIQFMRPILDLIGDEPYRGRLETIRRVGDRLKVDTSALERVLRLRNEHVDLMDVEVDDLFASYIDSIEKIIDAVDAIK